MAYFNDLFKKFRYHRFNLPRSQKDTVLQESMLQYLLDQITREHDTSLSSRNKALFHIKGIQIAVDYFVKVHYRVQVVIPTSWIRSKRYAVLDSSQLDILHQLQTQNVICCTPPTDDAYALAMARREDCRARVRKFNHSQGGSIVAVVSNNT